MNEAIDEKKLGYDPNFVAVPLDFVPLNATLSFGLYLKLNGSLVPFRTPGEMMTRERKEALAQRTDAVFVQKTKWVEFSRAAEQFLKVSNDDLKTACRLLTLHLKSAEEKIELYQDSFLEMAHLSERLCTAIRSLAHEESELVHRYREPSLYFANHSVNVAVYSGLVATRLKLPLVEIRSAILAGLLHNIGNLAIPRDILYKTIPLEDAEWRTVNTHPLKGAEMLKKLFAPDDVVTVALQHHERADGSGYPDALVLKQIHLLSRICAACDVFDAMQSDRPYQKGLDRTAAVTKLNQMAAKFDPNVIKVLSQSEPRLARAL